MDSGPLSALPSADLAAGSTPPNFTLKDLVTVTNPCRKTACVLVSIAGGLGITGALMVVLGGPNPATFAIGIATLFAAGIIGIVALCMEFNPTRLRANVRTLCAFCQERHPREFEQFIASPKFSEVATRDAGGCWSAKQNRKDSDVLDLLVGWIANSEAFATGESIEALDQLCIHSSWIDGWGYYNFSVLVSEKVVQICAKAGAIAPFQRALESIYWRPGNGHNAKIDKELKQIMCSIPLMPELGHGKFLRNDHCRCELRQCLANDTIALELLHEVEKLDLDKRLKLLNQTDAYGATFAEHMAEKCRIPDLVPRLFALIKDPKDLSSMLKHVANNGNTFGLIICGWNNPSAAIDFLKYVSGLSVEERVEILSQRNDDRKNIYSMIVEFKKNTRVGAAFIECLEKMTPDQRARCM